MATASPVLQFVSASHATYPVLTEAEGSIHGLESRTPPRNGDSGLCISPGPLEKPLLAKARRDLRHSAQKEGCHDDIQKIFFLCSTEESRLELHEG